MADERPAAPGALDRGREAYRRQAWTEAHRELSAADRARPLELDDLERLGISAHLLGLVEDSHELLTRGHQQALQEGRVTRAVRLAFWHALDLMQRGNVAQGSGWLARANRLLEGQPDSVERGYLLLPEGLRSLDEHDYDTAEATFSEMASIADRFADPDLGTLARLGRGDSLIGQGNVQRGVALLDDAMVSVTAGELSPLVVGIVYCAVIETCHRIFDLRRAQEWTDALTRWVRSQPDLVAYRGQCLVYRAEILALHGEWDEAGQEAARAHELLLRPPPAPAGEAIYQRAELERLRGNHASAERAYRDAARQGRSPQPGLALLRLAQGRPAAGLTSIGRSLDEVTEFPLRPRLLEAQVEIALAAGEPDLAQMAADELGAMARSSGAPLLAAIAARADGAMRLARGDARAAGSSLRSAIMAWQALDAPYEVARARLQLADACRLLGDEYAAAIEQEAAIEALRMLGAASDLERVARGTGTKPAPPGPLTRRELEILRLVAAGKTNRAIAAELVISEKTVARHLSNIFTKLDLPSRAAATAYAYEHRIVAGSA
ncbi:MAG TPA: LuxR C-terminal-related transcriptional regulator [Candidatus Limnocylindrales bacterium]